MTSPTLRMGPFNKVTTEQPIWFAHVELARGLADAAIKLKPPRDIFPALGQARRALAQSNPDLHQVGHGFIGNPHRLLWAPFTARMLQAAREPRAKKRPIVFVLWGGSAKEA